MAGVLRDRRCDQRELSAQSLEPLEGGLAVSAIWSPPPRADKLLGEDDDAIRIYDAALADYARAAQRVFVTIER